MDERISSDPSTCWRFDKISAKEYSPSGGVEYPTGAALLADVRLRLDGAGEESAAIVVEGPDDWKLFRNWRAKTTEVVPAGGRRKLLAAHAAVSDYDRDRIVFVTDCDYEVRRGLLVGARELVITQSCDIEGDLLDVTDIVDRVIAEMIAPTRLGILAETRKRLMDTAHELAGALGRARCAAQPFGVSLDNLDIAFSRYYDKRARHVNFEKIVRTVGQHLAAGGVPIADWNNAVGLVEEDYRLRKGKDILDAMLCVARSEYGCRNVSREVLLPMLRLASSANVPEELEVIRRLRRWEQQSGRALLRSLSE